MSELDPTFVRQCMEKILPPGYKPEDYVQALEDPYVPIRIALEVVREIRHQLKMREIMREMRHV